MARVLTAVSSEAPDWPRMYGNNSGMISSTPREPKAVRAMMRSAPVLLDLSSSTRIGRNSLVTIESLWSQNSPITDTGKRL